MANPLGDFGEQRHRVGAAVAVVVGGKQRAEIGQAGRTEQRVGDGVRDRVAVGMALPSAAQSGIVTPPRTSGGSVPNGCTSKPSPTRFLTCVLLR